MEGSRTLWHIPRDILRIFRLKVHFRCFSFILDIEWSPHSRVFAKIFFPIMELYLLGYCKLESFHYARHCLKNSLFKKYNFVHIFYLNYEFKKEEKRNVSFPEA